MPILLDADLKSHLKPGGISGTQHDSAVAAAVAATNAAVVRHCERSFDKVDVAAETARIYSRAGEGAWRGIVDSCTAVVHDIWDATNLVIRTDVADDGTFATVWDADDYQLEPLNQLDGDAYSPWWRIRAVGSKRFPCRNRRAALQVTAAWGWEAVPADVFEAALIKAARLFARKDSPQGVAGFGDFGVVRISRSEDPDAAALLDPFVHPLAQVP